MLGFDTGLSIGAVLPQTGGPFSNASINGTYMMSQTPGGGYYSAAISGVGVSSGNGSLARTLDLNGSGNPMTLTPTTTLTIGSDGRGTDTGMNSIYVVSPTRFLMMTGTSYYPGILDLEQ